MMFLAIFIWSLFGAIIFGATIETIDKVKLWKQVVRVFLGGPLVIVIATICLVCALFDKYLLN
jgi:hypothetical protein